MTENEALEKHKEDCRRCRDKACVHGWDCLQKKDIEVYEEIQQYRAIGTVEGYERAIQSSIENYNLYREYKAKVQEYKAIGTIEEFKALKEKRKTGVVCPICGKLGTNRCEECGQDLTI